MNLSKSVSCKVGEERSGKEGSPALPRKVRELLASCPRAGGGVHNWLFRTAFKLHKRVSNQEELIELLAKAVSDCGRVVEDDARR